MPTPSECLLDVMLQHVGQINGISARDLAERLNTTTRRVRKQVSSLRNVGHPICGTPGTGYYVAETPEELEITCVFLRSRAMHSLQLEARLRRLSLPALLGQLSLSVDSLQHMEHSA